MKAQFNQKVLNGWDAYVRFEIRGLKQSLVITLLQQVKSIRIQLTLVKSRQ